MNAEQNRGMLVDTTFTDYRQPDNGEYIDDDDLLLSMDNLLKSLDTMDEPWYQWTDEQKDIMMEHIYYYAELIETAKQTVKEINKCWAAGPIPKSQVKKVRLPKTDLSFIYTEKESKKKGTGDDKEFLDYLKTKCCTNENTDEHFDEMPTGDLDKMAEHLRKRFVKLEKGKNTLLLDHISFGYDLTRAKSLFKSHKRKRRNQSKISWESWISNNAKICKRYANKHIAIYRLVSEYPELKKLALSFTELYAISGRIRAVFSRNNAEGLKWK